MQFRRFKWSLLPFSTMLGGDLPRASHTMHLPNVGQQPKKLLPTSEATTKSASNHQLTSNNLDQKSRLTRSLDPLLETEENIGPSRQENRCFLAFLTQKEGGGLVGTIGNFFFRRMILHFSSGHNSSKRFCQLFKRQSGMIWHFC